MLEVDDESSLSPVVLGDGEHGAGRLKSLRRPPPRLYELVGVGGPLGLVLVGHGVDTRTSLELLVDDGDRVIDGAEGSCTIIGESRDEGVSEFR